MGMFYRNDTKVVKVGNIYLGGNNPIRIGFSTLVSQ